MNEWDNVINENTYDIFINNTVFNSHKIIIKRGLSVNIIPKLTDNFDFIYVDGDHSEKTVWLDAIYSFEKLNIGGIMIFDDYEWNSDDKSPKKAVDKFLTEYSELIEILFINYQVGIKKIKIKLIKK